jgi:hypothetical protein
MFALPHPKFPKPRGQDIAAVVARTTYDSDIFKAIRYEKPGHIALERLPRAQ